MNLEPGTKPITLFISGPFGFRKGPDQNTVLILKQKKMLKNLKKNFLTYCENKDLEVNQNQIDVIKKLQEYHDTNYKSFF